MGAGLEGITVNLCSSPSHGSLGHGGVGGALPDEAHDHPVPQVGDVEGGEPAVVWEEPIGSGGGLWGDGGWGGSSPQKGDIPLQLLDSGLVGLGTLEKGAGGDLGDLSEIIGASPGAEGLENGKGRLGGDASFREDGLRKCRRGA